MKGYLLLLVVVTALLLAMPLPSLGMLDEPAAKPTEAEPAAVTTASTTTTTTEPTTAATDSFRVLNAASNQVVTLSERDFLIGTLAAEMYPTNHPEALKAQAVAAYTYFSRARTAARADGENADFSDVPSTFPALYTVEGMRERWGDRFNEYYQKLCDAVDAVEGRVILYDGEPILAVYHAMSAQSTETAKVVWGRDLPYLQSVKSPGDTLSPSYESVVTVPADDFAAAVKKQGITLSGDAADWVDLDSITRSKAGTVTKVPIGKGSLTGRELRELFDLRSSVFTLAYRKNTGFVFTVHGYGHGVGLSQTGAQALAEQGKTWEEIIKYYYTDVTIG